MLDWMGEHKGLLTWLTIASAVLFAASILIAPAMIVRIPADYFAHKHRPRRRLDHAKPIVRVMLNVLRNVAGYLLLLVGLVMLVTPGQGLLMLLLGFLLVDFPGKYRAEQWVLSRPRVLKTINWFRRRHGKEPLVVPGGESDRQSPRVARSA